MSKADDIIIQNRKQAVYSGIELFKWASIAKERGLIEQSLLERMLPNIAEDGLTITSKDELNNNEILQKLERVAGKAYAYDFISSKLEREIYSFCKEQIEVTEDEKLDQKCYDIGMRVNEWKRTNDDDALGKALTEEISDGNTFFMMACKKNDLFDIHAVLHVVKNNSKLLEKILTAKNNDGVDYFIITCAEQNGEDAAKIIELVEKAIEEAGLEDKKDKLLPINRDIRIAGKYRDVPAKFPAIREALEARHKILHPDEAGQVKAGNDGTGKNGKSPA